MKKRYCNRCGKELPLQFAAGEHILYDCWIEQDSEQQEAEERQKDYDLCKRCYKQFCKFMGGKHKNEVQ